VPTALLVRHGRSSANTAGVLAGWSPGVFLDDVGEQQAAAVGQQLVAASLRVVEVVSSPLDRCLQTADLLSARLTASPGEGEGSVTRSVHDGLGECQYGAWTGRRLAELVTDPLWRVVQDRPSEARFPSSAAYGSESLSEMQERALRAVREVDARVLELHGPHAVWVAVSHGDIIKSVLAHAAGAHLDDFQRFVVSPGSVSAVRYTKSRPLLLRLGDVGGDLRGLRPVETSAVPEGDAEVGGGAGTTGTPGTAGSVE
jgi:probable phosphomutase (TIGR03848 family)